MTDAVPKEPTPTNISLPELAEILGLETKPTKDLCHYTSQEGLIGILTQKGLYATDVSYLNDSQEFVYAVNLAKRYFKDKGPDHGEWLNVLNLIESVVGQGTVHVASFSEEPDLLSQWRGYRSKGSGFALCLSPERISKIAEARNWLLFKCIYDVAQQIEVLRKMEEHATNLGESTPLAYRQLIFALVLVGFGTVLKHPKFKEEAEWRAIQHIGGIPLIRPGASTLVPYIKFPLTGADEQVELSKLVVGPTPHAPLALRAARSLLQGTKTICPDPVSSEIPFRNW